ncbi:MAG: hypothetical protein IJ258_07425 [Methanobrevibacter sp.]|uniref:hypothetical protein n=1 Tax=Methanobrevibacter sp. TaxID=66852 RepID=UPI0025DF0B3F|nr:hypothetical protein [Methanobrevibacter sp.]MBQ8017920.1 hypothetical protein [Methanobrevibacter sp.]
MGILINFRTSLLNNHVGLYNIKHSYLGEDKRKPRFDRINTCLDLFDAFTPVIKGATIFWHDVYTKKLMYEV